MVEASHLVHEVLRELDTLVQDVGKDGNVIEANRALKATAHFMCIQSVLQAPFGYCTEYAGQHLPKFSLERDGFDTLHNKRIMSVLPYVFDQVCPESR